MGDPGLHQSLPDIPALLSQRDGDGEQATATDTIYPIITDLSRNHRLLQGTLCGLADGVRSSS